MGLEVSSAVGRRRGFVLATFLCCLPILLVFLGLAIDGSYLELEKTRMQTAADAAAIGGAQEVKMSGSANAAEAARADASLNGFTDGQNGVAVSVNSPPQQGYSTGDATAVEVVVSQQVPTFFMNAIGVASVGMQSRAVAHLGSGGTCIQTLNPSASGAFTISGSATLTASCGIAVPSTSGSAFTASGSATVTATGVSVGGGASISGNAKVSPAPVTGVSAGSDPLAYVAAPSVGSCDYTNTKISSASAVTLPPGVYCNGINVSGTAQVTFAPAGVFILKGGGLTISGNSTVNGAGVMIYNTYGGGYSYGPVSISGNSDVSLSAPTTGPQAGVLIFQDRSVVSGGANTFSGSSTLNLTGALYFPTTHVDYSGDTKGTNAYSILVADTVTFSGSTKMNSDYSSLPSGSPIKGSAVLTE